MRTHDYRRLAASTAAAAITAGLLLWAPADADAGGPWVDDEEHLEELGIDPPPTTKWLGWRASSPNPCPADQRAYELVALTEDADGDRVDLDVVVATCSDEPIDTITVDDIEVRR